MVIKISDPAKKPLSLRVNFFWMFFGNGIYAVCQWGMISTLAKLGSPRYVGQFGLGLAISAPLIFLTNLSLRPVLATDAKREFSFSVYFTLRLVSTFIFVILLIAIAPIFSRDVETLFVALIVGIAKAVESISDIIYGLLQQRERLDRVAISLGLRGGLALIGLLLIMEVTRNILLSVLWIVIAWLGVLIFFDIPQAVLFEKFRIISLVSYKGALWRLVKLSFPVGVTMMLVSLKANIPKYLISHLKGEAYLGYFVALNYLFVAGNMVSSALGQASSPRLANYFAKRLSSSFWKLMAKMLSIGALLGLLGFLLALFLGKPLLAVMYTSDYARFSDVLIWLSLAAAVGYIASFVGYAATAVREFQVQPIILVISIFTLITGLFLWLPTHGLVGVAWAMTLSFFVQGLGFLIVTLRVWLSLHMERNHD